MSSHIPRNCPTAHPSTTVIVYSLAYPSYYKQGTVRCVPLLQCLRFRLKPDIRLPLYRSSILFSNTGGRNEPFPHSCHFCHVSHRFRCCRRTCFGTELSNQASYTPG